MDRDRIEAFLDRFVGFVSGATTIGLLAIADRVGLLAWLGANEPGTADEIAEHASLDPRYVLEIMSGLAAAGVVEYDPATEIFTLPPEHALFLSSEGSPYYMGGWFDMIPEAMSRIDALAEVAREGGGIPFSEFGAEAIRGIDRGNTPSQTIFLISRWLPAVPGLIDRLEAGIRVADVGCGSGTVARLIADAYPASSVVGIDPSEKSLLEARKRGAHLTNLSFVASSASDLADHGSFDLITTFDVVHDMSDPLGGMKGIRTALNEKGVYLMAEPNASSNLEDNLDDRGAMLYGISTMHCLTQSLAEGGAGLGTAWGRQLAEDYAARAGFGGFEHLESISNRFTSFYLLTV